MKKLEDRIIIRTLGRFELERNGVPIAPPRTRKACALLVYLCTHRETDIARADLVLLFWPHLSAYRGMKCLSHAMWLITCSLGLASKPIAASRFTVRWVADSEIDCLQFTDLAQLPELLDPNEALSLYSGDLCPGNNEAWVVEERARLKAMHNLLSFRAENSSTSHSASLLAVFVQDFLYSLPVPAVRIDQSGRFIRANAPFANLLAPDEAHGAPHAQDLRRCLGRRGTELLLIATQSAVRTRSSVSFESTARLSSATIAVRITIIPEPSAHRNFNLIALFRPLPRRVVRSIARFGSPYKGLKLHSSIA